MKLLFFIYSFIFFQNIIFAQGFSFVSSDGVQFSFEVQKLSGEISVSVEINNCSKNSYILIDTTGMSSFTMLGDSSAFIGIGLDYSFYPYANDHMRNNDRLAQLAPNHKHKLAFFHKEGRKELYSLRIGFDYYILNDSKKRPTKIELDRWNHSYFNFTISLRK